MTDLGYYEQRELWTAERYLGNARELARFKTVMDLIPADVDSLCDVGTGNGAFLRFLEDHGCRANLAGIERSTTARDCALCAAPIHEGSIDQLPFADREFDAVASLEVLEHLPFGVFERGLREIARVARNSILISVPYREKRRNVRCDYCHCQFHPYYHLRSFDEARLADLFQGFEFVQSITIDVVEPVPSTALRILRRLRSWVQPRAATPSGVVCPLCGFRRAVETGGTLGKQADLRLRASIKRFLTREKSVPVWIAALYRRKGT
jgi:SAM-dependent methyltransferase